MNLTQQELSDKLGVSRNYIWLIENGAKPMSDKLAKKLAILTEYPQPSASNGALQESNNNGYLSKIDAEEIKHRLATIETLLLQLLTKDKE